MQRHASFIPISVHSFVNQLLLGQKFFSVKRTLLIDSLAALDDGILFRVLPRHPYKTSRIESPHDLVHQLSNIVRKTL